VKVAKGTVEVEWQFAVETVFILIIHFLAAVRAKCRLALAAKTILQVERGIAHRAATGVGFCFFCFLNGR
jgi:hypothetical protein